MLAMLYSYRNKCASDAPDSQLILPETLRLLPLFTLCAHKMLALRLNAEVIQTNSKFPLVKQFPCVQDHTGVGDIGRVNSRVRNSRLSR